MTMKVYALASGSNVNYGVTLYASLKGAEKAQNMARELTGLRLEIYEIEVKD